MREYYKQRAAEYDDWWRGTGLFEQRDRPGWDEDREALIAALRALAPRRTLDIACGTGFLTRELPGEVTGLDQSESMVEIARSRGVDAIVGDALHPPGGFERIFTSHFYGHLDEAQREQFSRLVTCELVVVDSKLRPGQPDELWQDRTLNDGSTHSVYKRWFTAASLQAELGGEAFYDGEWFVGLIRAGAA
jgi:demethylmenaquinone methyltransferase/2-methoxy-6-polyprenyl-1,4-benzoquinol methylase